MGVYSASDWASKWHCDTSQSNGLWGCIVPQTEPQNDIVTPVSLIAHQNSLAQIIRSIASCSCSPSWRTSVLLYMLTEAHSQTSILTQKSNIATNKPASQNKTSILAHTLSNKTIIPKHSDIVISGLHAMISRIEWNTNILVLTCITWRWNPQYLSPRKVFDSLRPEMRSNHCI